MRPDVSSSLVSHSLDKVGTWGTSNKGLQSDKRGERLQTTVRLDKSCAQSRHTCMSTTQLHMDCHFSFHRSFFEVATNECGVWKKNINVFLSIIQICLHRGTLPAESRRTKERLVVKLSLQRKSTRRQHIYTESLDTRTYFEWHHLKLPFWWYDAQVCNSYFTLSAIRQWQVLTILPYFTKLVAPVKYLSGLHIKLCVSHAWLWGCYIIQELAFPFCLFTWRQSCCDSCCWEWLNALGSLRP